jgi:hypothetical protein
MSYSNRKHDPIAEEISQKLTLASKELNQYVSAECERLGITQNMGLTPDQIKFSDRYRELKKITADLFEQLRKQNSKRKSN